MNNTKLMTEFLGTFFLLTIVAFTGNPLAIGIALMVLVYSAAHISGAHFNPAVTLAVFLKKGISQQEAFGYVVAQLVGGVFAAFFYAQTHNDLFIPQPDMTSTWLGSLMIEIIFTFLLVKTILTVAADKRVKGNQFFGLAIGGALMVAATAGGPISGGAFNPVVGIAPLLLDVRNWSEHLPIMLLYLIGPLAGAALAYQVDEYVTKS